MKHFYLAVLLGASFFTTDAVAECADDDDSIVCQQRRQLDEIWVDFNKTSKEMIDTVMTEPSKAIDMGCLDDLRSIDLSVFTIDPRSILSGVYGQVMDAIRNRVCSAIEDKYNEAAAELEMNLEAPMGLGSVSVGLGGSAESLSDLSRTRAVIDNTQAQRELVDKTLGGDYPTVYVPPVTQRRIEAGRVKNEGSTDQIRMNDAAQSIANAVSVSRLFGDKDDDEKNDDDGGN